jgi:hypothetical protein
MAAAPPLLSTLLVEAQHALGLSQAGLGKILGGVTRRTIWRYQGGKVRPHATDIHALARLVHPINRDLAAQLALSAGVTLVSLGLEPDPAAQAPAPVPDAKQTLLFVDAIVCAAAEALDVSPRAVRGALHAAFARARETGVAIDVLEKALAPTKVSASASKGAPKPM